MKKYFWDNVISGLDTDITASALEKASRNLTDKGEMTFIQLDSREYERLCDSRRFFRQLVACLLVGIVAVTTVILCTNTISSKPGGNPIVGVPEDFDPYIALTINDGECVRYSPTEEATVNLTLDLPADSENKIVCMLYLLDGDRVIPVSHNGRKTNEMGFVPDSISYTTKFTIDSDDYEPLKQLDENNRICEGPELVMEYNYLSGAGSGTIRMPFSIWLDSDDTAVQSDGNVNMLYNGGYELAISPDAQLIQFNMVADKLMSDNTSVIVSVSAKINGVATNAVILDKLTNEKGYSSEVVSADDIVQKTEGGNSTITVNAGELMMARLTLDTPDSLKTQSEELEIELTYLCSYSDEMGAVNSLPFIFTDTVTVKVR